MEPRRPRLSYYSYDSLQNPWCAGGGALRDFEVLRRYSKNWVITLSIGRYPGFVPQDNEGIRIRALGFGGMNWLSRLTFAISANFRILFDNAAIVGNSLSPFAPILSGLLLRNRFFVVIHHEVGGESLKKFGVVGYVPLLLESALFRGLRHFLVSNRAVAERIRRMNPKSRVFVTSNSIDQSLLSTDPKSTDPPFILFLGRFDIHMKGLDILIGAYQAMASASVVRLPRLIMAGAASPEAQAAVRKLIPENLAALIELRPNVSDLEKRDLFSSCLFFCGPSRFEGFGIAALEANAAGKAVLVTDTDGYRDSVSPGKTALLIPPGNVQVLRTALETLIQDAGLRETMGKAGRVWARGFNWDRIAEEEMKWIASMVEAQPS